MISYMISVRLQLPILPRHSALMTRSVMLTWTDQWMPTRSVTLLTKTPSQTWTWRKMLRFLRHFCSTYPLATLLQHMAARHSRSAASGCSSQNSAGGYSGWRHYTSGCGCSRGLLTERTHSAGTRP